MKKVLMKILVVLLAFCLFVSCNSDAVERLFNREPKREDSIIFVPVEVKEGKIVSGNQEVGITGTEETLSEDDLKALADKINEIQKNASVASFKETDLSQSTEINSTGLEAIIAALRKEAVETGEDTTVTGNIEQKTSSEVDLWVNVELSNIGVDDSSETLSLSYVEFEVKPMASTTVKNASGESTTVTTSLSSELLNTPVRFRLPVDKAITDIELAVYHEGSFIGYYPVLSANGEQFVEIESQEFSKYGYQIVNEKNAGAKIVETGTLYFKFEDAVSAVKSNETIKLLKPANPAKEIVLNKAITFKVDTQEWEYKDQIKADDEYVLDKKENGNVITYKITEFIHIEEISFKDETLSLSVGESKTLTATITPEDVSNKKVSWTSSNNDVVTVNSEGVITAKGVGEATITVTSEDGSKTTTCTITVTYNTVSFNMQGHGTQIESITNLTYGSKITKPAKDPTEAGYIFGGWYKDSSCSSEWKFDTDTINQDTTLYAKWSDNGCEHHYECVINADSANRSLTIDNCCSKCGKKYTEGSSTQTAAFDISIAVGIIVQRTSPTDNTWTIAVKPELVEEYKEYTCTWYSNKKGKIEGLTGPEPFTISCLADKEENYLLYCKFTDVNGKLIDVCTVQISK